MVTDFFPALNALRATLDEFYRIQRQGDGEELRRPVVNQLPEAFGEVNAFLEEAGEGAGTDLSEERRWGYRFLHSLAEAVRYKVKNI